MAKTAPPKSTRRASSCSDGVIGTFIVAVFLFVICRPR